MKFCFVKKSILVTSKNIKWGFVILKSNCMCYQIRQAPFRKNKTTK